MTTNGQSPFVTLFLHIKDSDPYKKETAEIINEILNQRIQGIKNEYDVYVSPAFPKLVYVLDENNIKEGTEFYNITKKAILCTSKRMFPDYISAKIMKRNYGGNVFSPMGCRAFLSPYKDDNGVYKFTGRFNIGVCTINLPQIGILSVGNEKKFWEILEKRINLVKEVGEIRYNKLKGILSDSSPIHYQHGALSRLKNGEKIDKLLDNGYSTVSIGYIGLYETCKLVLGESNTSDKGIEFSKKILEFLKQKANEWTEKYGHKYALYGTPAESLCHRFASIDKKNFGEIKDITDKGYYTNSFHVDVREDISAFEKLKFESQFQDISTGGCISYVEIPNMTNNLKALETLVTYIYDNIQYAEFNTRSDYCASCGFDGEIKVNKDNEWECPQCGCKDKHLLTVVRRTCGYLGENFWNEGKTKEMSCRVMHI